MAIIEEFENGAVEFDEDLVLAGGAINNDPCPSDDDNKEENEYIQQIHEDGTYGDLCSLYPDQEPQEESSEDESSSSSSS